MISGELTPAEAIDQEVLAVVAGDATLLERFAATFHIDTARTRRARRVSGCRGIRSLERRRP